jgi:hypothetical protein
MNPELEAILKAYDAATQALGDDAVRLKDIYESRLADVLDRHPSLSHSALQLAVELAYRRWKKAQEKFPSLPSQA